MPEPLLQLSEAESRQVLSGLNLSEAQRAEVGKLLAMRKRMEREERYWWFEPTKPPNNDQQGFVDSKSKVRCVFGGNRSGKTAIGVYDCLTAAQGLHPVRSKTNPPPVHMNYLAPSYEDGINAVILKKFKEMTPRQWLKGGTWSDGYSIKGRQLMFANGSTVRFFSYEQDPNKMGGTDLDGAYLDEHAPKDVFMEMLARTVDRNGWIVLTMTPEAGITWEFEELIEKADRDDNIAYWFFSTYDNPHLQREGIQQLENLILDERLKEAKLYGRFVALSGLVYPQFNKGIHVIEPFELPYRWHRQFIIDPHLKKPTAMLWRAIDPEGISYVYREEEFPATHGGVKELANFIRTRSAGEKIDQWIGDEAMGGAGINVFGEMSVLEALRRTGLPMVGTNLEGGKEFALGVSKVRHKLQPDPISGKPNHFVFSTCPKTVKQYMRYRYRKETKTDDELLREHVVNVDDDFVTCDRYGIMAEPDTYSPVTIVSGLADAEW